MKKIIFIVLTAAFFWLGSSFTATAQDQVAQSDQITDPTGQVLQSDDTDSGMFGPVTVKWSATSSVAVQFPTIMANKTVTVQQLDGGAIVGFNNGGFIVGADGKLSFQFQVSSQTGLYRVLVISPDAGDSGTAAVVAMVQFQAVPPTN